MKCAKCGALLRVGSIYCSQCGQEAQIVSDDLLLEEEILQELLQDEPAKNDVPEEKAKRRNRKRGKKKLFLILSCVFLLLILAVALLLLLSHQRRNSYDYQMNRGRQYAAEKNYTKAVIYYENALALKENDLMVRFALIDLYELMGEEGDAISMLYDVIQLDNSNVEAFQRLIDVYQSKSDYDAILKLKELSEDPSVCALFDAFQVNAPVFQPQPGIYGDDFSISFSADTGCTIYFTINGKDPVADGQIYREPIRMEEQGTVSVLAVAVDEHKLYSEITSGEFTLKYQKPTTPRAIPDSGSFQMPVTIELKAEGEGHIYYTWDGTDPTVESTEYTGPIEVPEGNNILSVLFIDKHGLMSDVLKCNYKYIPTVN